MARPIHKVKASKKNVRVALMLPANILVRVDEEAKKLTAEVPGSNVTRSEVVRRAVYKFVGEA